MPLFLVFWAVFKSAFLKIPISSYFKAGIAFLIAISSYVIAEYKFGGRFIATFSSSSSSFKIYLPQTFYILKRFFHDNIFGNYQVINILMILFSVTVFWLIKTKKNRSKIIYLVLLFLGGLFPYLFSRTSSYYYSVGVNVSLIILTVMIVSKTIKYSVIAYLIIAAILINNILLIVKTNKHGLNRDMVIQSGMLVSKQT